ncbi:unnamed protein product, partial [marine sediment metagenome]
LPLLEARKNRGMPYRKYGIPFSITAEEIHNTGF